VETDPEVGLDQTDQERNREPSLVEVNRGYLPATEIVRVVETGPAAGIVPVAENQDSSQVIVPATVLEIDRGTVIVLEMETDQAAGNQD
tara:strand:- start:49093 stop:49359 length:267 start_codon:yes stop_codon:yes gene_type:complete